MRNICNMFLTQRRRLETSSRHFYDFIKMPIQRDFAIFNGRHLPFLIAPYSPFQKSETLEPGHNWLLINQSKLLKWKGSRTQPQSSRLFKKFLRIIAVAHSYQLAKFGDLMSCGSKDILKKYHVSCTNTHQDVTYLLNYRMVKNTKI